MLVAAVLVLIGNLLAPAPHAAAAADGETRLAIDVVTEGNSGSSTGQVESCLSVDTGQDFDIDIIIQDGSEITGFQTRLTFDPAVLEVKARKADLFLGSGGLEAGDLSFPSDSGAWLYGYANTPARSGTGVLVRITLSAVGPGTSKLGLPLGPRDTTVIDSSQAYVKIAEPPTATVVVGDPCPGAAGGPSPEQSGAPGTRDGPTGTGAAGSGAASEDSGVAGPSGAAGQSGTGSDTRGLDPNADSPSSDSIPVALIVGPVLLVVALAVAFWYMRRARSGVK